MPGRLTPLVTGQYYHIFNRGSDKRDIFIDPDDYSRFIQTFYYYQFLGPKLRFSKFIKQKIVTFEPLAEKKVVEVICYCLMPNHFHFLVKQLKDNGISIFISQLANSYTRYFNTKRNRVGPLLQGAFKAVPVESDEQLLHLSRYIHLNPIVSDLVKVLDNYQWSSYAEYINDKASYCQTNEILNFFPSSQEYKEFLEDHIEYGRSLHQFKHQLIDIDN